MAGKKVWVQCPETKQLIPKDEYLATRHADRACYIIPDMQPYKAVAGDMAGKEIGGRRQHREFLRRNNFIEVGNEWSYFTRHGGKTPDNPTLKWGK